MLSLKKSAVVVLAFASSAVFAGTMGPVCTPGSVTIPCVRSAWDFAGQALYLNPSYSNMGYYGSTTVGSVERFNRENYNWGWGFKLEGSYHFGTGNDINLNWYHYNRSTNASFANGFENRFSQIINTNATASVQPKWDAVNLELGQHVDLGEFDKIRFHGGFQYARIQTLGSFTGTGATITTGGVTTVDPRSFTVNNSMTYNGFGPRVGADMDYNWNNGFTVYANAATALLVGSSSFNRNVNNDIFTITSISGSQTALVPELEAKLGGTYTYAMSQGDLSLDAGWMWVNYFNAQHEGIGTGVPTVSNVGFQGPYIGLKWVGNVV